MNSIRLLVDIMEAHVIRETASEEQINAIELICAGRAGILIIELIKLNKEGIMSDGHLNYALHHFSKFYKAVKDIANPTEFQEIMISVLKNQTEQSLAT